MNCWWRLIWEIFKDVSSPSQTFTTLFSLLLFTKVESNGISMEKYVLDDDECNPSEVVLGGLKQEIPLLI